MLDNHVLRKQVNASGFPFQIRIEREILKSYEQHSWLPIAPEHYWKNPETKREGFIDLVLHKEPRGIVVGGPNYDEYMVVECKRVKEGSWVFLNPNTSQHKNASTKLLTVYQISEQRKPVVEWADLKYEPLSYMSSFCVVPGQADKQTPMLERISAELLDSLEHVAAEELNYLYTKFDSTQQNDFQQRIFVPVIVTNAKLVLCTFEPDEVELSKGLLEEDSGEFEKVEYIRFQKSLSTNYSTKDQAQNLESANKLNERTIFVVSSSAITPFLKNWGAY